MPLGTNWPMKMSQRDLEGPYMTKEEADGDLKIRTLRLLREIDALEIEMDLETPRDLEGLRAQLDKLTQDIDRLAEEERESRVPGA